MKSFLKLLAFDVALWATIIAGLYLHLSYFYNLALFVIPTMGILAMLGGLYFLTMAKKPESEWPEQSLKTIEKLRARPKYFFRYSAISTALEILLIAATGHFIVATIYLIGTFMFLNGRQLVLGAKLEPAEGV